MRTSEEIYHRVRWDPRFDPARFVFGVEQRAAPVKRVPLATFVPGGEIPWHRVLFVEAEGRLVWDRASGLDRLDESGLGRAQKPRLLRAPFFTAGTPHVWHPVDGWCPADAGAPPASARRQAKRIRILTWNTLWDRYDSDLIHTPRRRVLLLEALRRADADVIALQEVEADLLRMLASAEWVRAGYTLSTAPRGNEVESSGLLLLSRLPVREAGMHAFGPHKALAAVTVETETAGGVPLVVAATHLSSDHSRDGAARRRAELARIAEGLAAVDGDLVLVGDFNDASDRPTDTLGLTDAWSLIHGPEDRTPTFDPTVNPLAALASLSGRASRLDRVLLRPDGARPTAAALYGDTPDATGLYVSDHFGVLVDVEPATARPPRSPSPADAAAATAGVLDVASTARTAVAWIPPRALWPKIQQLRSEHDPLIHRWPPHVNVLFGFVPESEFDRAAPLLADAAAAVQPFAVRLDGVHTFGHREHATVWLDPAGGAEKQWAELWRALARRFPRCGNRTEGFTPHLTLGRTQDPSRTAAQCAARLTEMTAEVGELVVLSRRGEEPMRPRAVITLGTGDLRWLPDSAAEATADDATTTTTTSATAIGASSPLTDTLAARITTRFANALAEAPVSPPSHSPSTAAVTATATATPMVHTVGSRRMGCALPGADLDLVAALPANVDIAALSTTIADALPKADRLREVTGARVPGLRLTVEGLDVDLSLVVATGQVRPDEAVARRAELGEAAAIALSAVSDADAVRAATGANQDAFTRLARAVKAWAKARGLDSAPFGGVPGIAWATLAARVVAGLDHSDMTIPDTQVLLQRFFATWAAWDWRNPITLDTSEAAAPPATPTQPPSPMTVLTPTFPVRNCTGHVTPGGRDLLAEELYRAWELTEAASATGPAAVTANGPATGTATGAATGMAFGIGAGIDAALWADLLAPPDLHRRHAAWAVVTVSAETEAAFDRVLGRVRGRMLALVSALNKAGVAQAHAWPRPFESGPTAASYAIGLGRTPPDRAALDEIAARRLTGLPGVRSIWTESGAVPTLR